MIRFEKVNLPALKKMRDAYFRDITLSQELHLEWMVAGGTYYKIFDDEEEIGYFIKSKDNVLIEFYLMPILLTRKEEIFEEILDRHAISKIYCKSFDPVLLNCSHAFSKSSKIMGTIFRDYTSESNVPFDQSLSIRLAEESDIPLLLTHKSELYETPEELEYTVFERMLYMFEKEGRLIGCGYLIKILPNRNYYDIGMWVNPDHRKRGYGTMIISYMKEYCLTHNYIPICGCAIENTASRKTIEKNGFVSKYCLLEFEV